ncbi:GPI mannosyltransferase 2-like isoform X2 [Phalaenopsis equestris]|uniref:GPI mannosyltransferase 2-like isoform X2 n=1 Tax=Phalaenopsis equestris TaxID=78828 RepID=UPI0009E56B6F|nr:GPI mannosyltransferase 2-like isoform X2 [Phalaenopsis equestris]
MREAERLVLRLAMFSRFLLLSLIITWRFLFPPYDSSAQLNPSCLSSSSNVDDLLHLAEAGRVLWPRIGALIEGSVVWDSVCFVRIAECGYEYEQNYAFLPLLPLSISLLSGSVFAPLIPVIGYRAVLALSGYVLNNIAFVLAAIYLYKYSKSLYALFLICGIFYLFSGSNAMAMLLLAVSGAARSNGAINAEYFCLKELLQTYDAITYKRSISLGLQAIVNGALCSVCLLVPFAAFQAYGYYNKCFHGASDGLRPWCSSRVPNLYGYLQSHYWGVGFLKYFEVKQLPNFLLASPILTISIASVIYYASLLQQSLHSFRITSDPHGKDHSGELISSDNSSTSLEFKGNHDLPRRKSKNKPKSSDKSHFVELEIDSFIKFKKGYCSWHSL